MKGIIFDWKQLLFPDLEAKFKNFVSKKCQYELRLATRFCVQLKYVFHVQTLLPLDYNKNNNFVQQQQQECKKCVKRSLIMRLNFHFSSLKRPPVIKVRCRAEICNGGNAKLSAISF